ncbi:sfk1 [Hyphodiscus hymeniophilus]|uniref:Sfk1 n=1 Tax=Hyphodiscus hymeniophilus TaxID=353542 RepID=A0A9P6SMM8_9HELO|nr:sfk1 [Hyphodiscus hymeniophilus]
MWGVSYWVFPVISGLTWLGMLLGLLIHWTSTGKPHYPSMADNQTIAYISDVGAESLKPLFIAGSCVTTVFLDLAFISDVFLRNRGRLESLTGSGRIVSWLSLLFAAIGTAGLILLSIFDTLHHHKLHDVFLLLFIAGYVISAVFICWEYQRLGIRMSPPIPTQNHTQTNIKLTLSPTEFRQHRILRISFWLKLVFILLEVILAIAFGSCNFKEKYNAAAVLEWTIAFVFTFYVFSFFVDLIPAVRTRHGRAKGPMGGQTEMEAEAGAQGRNTADSERTLGMNDLETSNGGKRHAGLANNF